MSVDPFMFLPADHGKAKTPSAPRAKRPSTPLQQLRVRSASAGYRKELRAEALRAYGSKCSCCGEAHPAFLLFVYASSGKSINGQHPLRVLRSRRWPKDEAKIECFNCHLGARVAGTCPHRRDRPGVSDNSTRVATPLDVQPTLG